MPISRMILAASLAWLVSTRPAAAAPAAPADLGKVLAMTKAEWSALDDAALIQSADTLWYWVYLGAKAPVPFTPEGYKNALRKANEMMYGGLERNPKLTLAYWKISRNLYDIGDLLPEEAKKERMELYVEMIRLTTKCVTEIDPKDGGCWLFRATGIGRVATTKGIVNSLMQAKDLQNSFQKVIDLNTSYVDMNGDPIINDARYGLGVFYRVVPESWVVKFLAGTRGDKAKSVSILTEAVAAQPHRLELQKELAMSLICLGQDKGDKDLAARGNGILRGIVAGEYDKVEMRATNAIDKKHATDVLAHNDRACGYSRDGYQNVDDEALKKAQKK